MLTAREGENALFVCSSKNILWSFNDDKLPVNIRIRNRSDILIVHSHRYNSGYYECDGENANGQSVYARGLLKIQGKSTFI